MIPTKSKMLKTGLYLLRKKKTPPERQQAPPRQEPQPVGGCRIGKLVYSSNGNGTLQVRLAGPRDAQLPVHSNPAQFHDALEQVLQRRQEKH